MRAEESDGSTVRYVRKGRVHTATWEWTEWKGHEEEEAEVEKRKRKRKTGKKRMKTTTRRKKKKKGEMMMMMMTMWALLLPLFVLSIFASSPMNIQRQTIVESMLVANLTVTGPVSPCCSQSGIDPAVPVWERRIAL